MKTYNLLVCIFLFANAFCLLRKKHATIKNSKEFKSSQEAENLLNKQAFGEHQNFEYLSNSIKNEFITEIIIKVDLINALPPAKELVKKISESEESYLSYEYEEGGASVIQDIESGVSYIVIHLAKLVNKFASCKDAQEKGFRGNKITIDVGGSARKVSCEQELGGGGWTMVLNEHQNLKRDIIIPIDTLGLDYTEVLFKATNHYEFNSRTASAEQYKFDGFLFQANALKFGEKWYLSEEYDINFQMDREHFPEAVYYNQAEKITVLEPSQTCFFEDANLPQYCAKSFIFNAPLPEGKLNAISDVESLGRYMFENNKWKAHFKLYLR